MAAESFMGVRVQGGLLPAELLSRIATGTLPGQASADYHLASRETVREAANRAWAYLIGVWAAYRQTAGKLPEGDRGTTLTRDRWLMILLRELDYGRLPSAPSGGLEAGDKRFPVSHVWERVPIHLLGHRIDLDRRTQGVAGAATSSPQSMVQELLNRSGAHQWAILSNGLTLRLLRDSTSLVGSAYVEFDLEAIFDGDLFSDFLLLYSLCHQSRLEVRDPEKGAASCWLESWRTDSLESGSRALNQLRDGVIDAITTLGTGFLGHPANGHLRDGLAEGTLRESDINHALLRVAYRLLFTFVAEDRALLLAPDADVQSRERYRDYFSTARLRRIARRRRGTRHADQWHALNVVWDGLGSVDGRPELGLVGIGGLFEVGPLDLFRECELTNEALLKAVRFLSLVEETGTGIKRVVDYRNLGAEELGSIYEALLEFVPSWNAEKRVFELLSAAGNDRKSTGSYYTPTSLIDCLLDSALDPVLDQAEREHDPEAALLALSVCDPACGSGHFLVAAARRIAKRVAAIRTGDPEPPPERVREALADVVGRCIYGVDLNPLAVELAKVSLWLETLDPGRPLAFLDAQLKLGNALIGATPSLLLAGIPDDAFSPIEGDDRRITAALKKQNRAERSGQDELFDTHGPSCNPQVGKELGAMLGEARPTSLNDIQTRRARLKSLNNNPLLKQQRLSADAWCAAFVWPKHAGAPKAVTDAGLRSLERGHRLSFDTMSTISELSAGYQFFHWHLEFPHLFQPNGTTVGPGWSGGFDVVLGNPPWERVKLEEQEFFSVRDPEIAGAPNASARKRLIASLEAADPALYKDFLMALRRAAGESHILRCSGRYPLTGRGDINTYAVFAEAGINLVSGKGRMGIIVPTGIATDATTQFFFRDLITRSALVSLYDFQTGPALWSDIGHARYKFCLFTVSGTSEKNGKSEFSFFNRAVDELYKENSRFELSPQEIELLNPNTGTCPVFRTRWEAELALSASRHLPVLCAESVRSIKQRSTRFGELSDLNRAESTGIMSRSGGPSGWLGVYEGKMLHGYNHKYAHYSEAGVLESLGNADWQVSSRPRVWLKKGVVSDHFGADWPGWVVAYRDIARATDERTMIACVLPATASDYTVRHLVGNWWRQPYLLATFNSFAFDYLLRLRNNGTHLSDYLVYQMPVPPDEVWGERVPELGATLGEWLKARVLELTYTSRDLESFARSLGDAGLPFISVEDRRSEIRAEIDAVMFRMYGFPQDSVGEMMDSFPIVRRNDVTRLGSYVTRDRILDRMAAIESSRCAKTVFRSSIDPAPGNGPRVRL